MQNDNNMGKILIIAGLLIAGLYLGAYVFNHYNPWLGILIAVITIVLIIYLLLKKK